MEAQALFGLIQAPVGNLFAIGIFVGAGITSLTSLIAEALLRH